MVCFLHLSKHRSQTSWGVIGGMKVNKPPEHTNCTIGLLCFDSKFNATLLLLKLASEKNVVKNLCGITKVYKILLHMSKSF
jgi:hypothetical protein